jgi:4a-hydroxytetrahydrobiopterin dehydratase
MAGPSTPGIRLALRVPIHDEENEMTTEPRWPEGWTEVERPPSLYRRFEFAAYPETRAFLERLAGLSKETGLYPDLSFTRTYVNVTVYGSDGTAVGAETREFAARAEALTAVEAA